MAGEHASYLYGLCPKLNWIASARQTGALNATLGQSVDPITEDQLIHLYVFQDIWTDSASALYRARHYARDKGEFEKVSRIKASADPFTSRGE